MSVDISKVHFDEKGLVPAIVQEESGQVLMLAYMNKESLEKTIETGLTWFYSRSRQRLWQKGEESGNIQQVKEISYDCDGDTLLDAACIRRKMTRALPSCRRRSSSPWPLSSMSSTMSFRIAA